MKQLDEAYEWWYNNNCSWVTVIKHFGDAYKAQLALCRYSVLGDKSPLPENWDWSVLNTLYFDPKHPLAWLVAQQAAK